MKITSVSVQMSRTLSKNYNSFSNSVGLTGELAAGDDYEEVVAQLQRECFRHLLKANPFDTAAKRKATEGRGGA